MKKAIVITTLAFPEILVNVDCAILFELPVSIATTASHRAQRAIGYVIIWLI